MTSTRKLRTAKRCLVCGTFFAHAKLSPYCRPCRPRVQPGLPETDSQRAQRQREMTRDLLELQLRLEIAMPWEREAVRARMDAIKEEMDR